MGRGVAKRGEQKRKGIGMRGRPPKPTKLKVLAGTLRADRFNPDEPQPLAGIPVCPDWLCPAAKERWAELVRTIGDTGVLTQADGDVMAQYCQAWARWKAAEEKLNQFGVPVLTEKTRAPYKTLYSIMSQERAHMTQLASLMGLEPSGRSRLHGATERQGRDKDRFFRAREA